MGVDHVAPERRLIWRGDEFSALFCDGRVHFLPNDALSPETLRGLLTAQGGEHVEIHEF